MPPPLHTATTDDDDRVPRCLGNIKSHRSRHKNPHSALCTTVVVVVIIIRSSCRITLPVYHHPRAIFSWGMLLFTYLKKLSLSVVCFRIESWFFLPLANCSLAELRPCICGVCDDDDGELRLQLASSDGSTTKSPIISR